MSLLKNISIAVSLLCAMAPAVASGANVDVKGIAPYVYPENIAKSPKSFTYMPDGESYLLLSDDGRQIGRYETATGKLLETVLDVTHTRENSISQVADFRLSPDGTKLALYTEKQPVYRHSFLADWYVFEIKRKGVF